MFSYSRVVVLLATVAVVGAAVAAPTLVGPAPSITDLALSVSDSQQAVLVFDPTDCRVTAQLIEKYADLLIDRGYSVRGAVLHPPSSPADTTVLRSAFHLAFPLSWDWDGRWGTSLASMGDYRAILVLTKKKRVTAVRTELFESPILLLGS